MDKKNIHIFFVVILPIFVSLTTGFLLFLYITKLSDAVVGLIIAGYFTYAYWALLVYFCDELTFKLDPHCYDFYLKDVKKNAADATQQVRKTSHTGSNGNILEMPTQIGPWVRKSVAKMLLRKIQEKLTAMGLIKRNNTMTQKHIDY